MDRKPRSSLPGRLFAVKDAAPMALSRSESARALRLRPENRPSPAPVKRKAVAGKDGALSTMKRARIDGEGKPTKREEQKAKTMASHERRADFEGARNRWIWKHRHLFTALLPQNSKFLDNMQKEMSEAHLQQGLIEKEEIEEQPSLIKGGQMKDYQLVGLSFLSWMHQNGMNAILGDEMGLGKTLQTLSLFAHIKEQDPVLVEPHLIICPMSVITSWVNEAARWVPSLRVLRFHATQSERDRLKRMVKEGYEFDLLITTYETYKSEDSWFKGRRWNYCVLDEGHKIKNAESEIAKALQGLGSQFRLILTGTPVQNNLHELWALLHWLYPTIFNGTTEHVFKDAFDLTQGKYDVKYLESAQRLLQTIMLRRTKNVVELSVPPREELTIFIPLTESQRFWTYKLLTRLDGADLREVFNTSLKNEDEQIRQAPGAAGQYARLMNLLMQLRQCCDHPYILQNAQPDPYSLGEHIVAASSKLIVIDRLLKDLIPKRERVLIFSQWTSMLDLLEDFMVLRKYRYARLDGSTPRPRRALDIRLFQQDNSPYDVYLISTRAGGLGINLTKANHVIMVDCDWNPQMDAQAIARAHRIGQTKTVKVYNLICRGSVEDQMLDRIRRKLFLSVKIMKDSSSSTNDDAAGIKTSELLSILRNGSSALDSHYDGMDLDDFLAAPIDDILSRSRQKQDIRDAKMKHELEGEAMDTKIEEDAAAEEERLLTGVAAVRVRLFEGKVLASAKIKEISQLGPAEEKRARRNRLVRVNGVESLVVWHTPTKAAPPKQKRGHKFDHEEWCLFCQDGGELYLCNTCPRVFHASCRGISRAEADRAPTLSCTQHKCAVCTRTTAEAGGMLFRCATCYQAFCEDCMPEGEIDAVGDSIPQLNALGYGPTSLAYFIRCHDCKEEGPIIKYDEYENKWWDEPEVEVKDEAAMQLDDVRALAAVKAKPKVDAKVTKREGGLLHHVKRDVGSVKQGSSSSQPTDRHDSVNQSSAPTGSVKKQSLPNGTGGPGLGGKGGITGWLSRFGTNTSLGGKAEPEVIDLTDD